MAKTTIAYLELQDYLIADLKHIKRKQKYLIARGVANPAKHVGLSQFLEILEVRLLKRHRSFLKGSASRSKKWPGN